MTKISRNFHVSKTHLSVEPWGGSFRKLLFPERVHKTARFTGVLNEIFVGLSPSNALQDHLQDRARTFGRDLTVRSQTKTFDGLCTMVNKELGLGMLPQSIAARYERRYYYHTLVIVDERARHRLCMTY